MNAPTTMRLPQSADFRFPAAIEPARQEDLRLVTGTGRYAADWIYPGMLHAFVIRSQVAHARISKTDFSAVREAPGVVAVLTASDVAEAGFGSLPNAVTNKARDGSPQKQVLMPVLATDRVLFAGQPIAMVIASTARAAQDAAELALVDLEALPAVAHVGDALAPGAPQLHPDVPGNLSLRFEAGDAEAVPDGVPQAQP
ncbi:MAG: xanthine dehydrogenase family protein molybdopterin-binding subunit [Betaproteobacteria bacterium]|nr:xanthine dehydrogenase family protein molybdopterin-binding subunit [Betaproteobacteria bacterium]